MDKSTERLSLELHGICLFDVTWLLLAVFAVIYAEYGAGVAFVAIWSYLVPSYFLRRWLEK